MELLQRVEQAVRRHGLLRQHAHVLVAVSGGPDSVALLHLLTRLRPMWQLQLHAAHVNHGLRDDARADADFVTDFSRSLGVPVTVTDVDVRAERRGGESTQQAARRLRLTALRKIARDVGARRIALGHHADDQAETVLLRLLRGAGTTGLGGMRPLRGPFIRPLLHISRADIEQYCVDQGLDVLRDPSNQSELYVRNRIRLQLLPLLAAEYNPNITERLARTAELLQADDAALERWATRTYKRARREATSAGVEGVVLSVPIVREQPDALRRRIVRSALRDAGADLRFVTYDHTDAAVALLADGAAGALTLPGNVRVERQQDVLLFSKSFAEKTSRSGSTLQTAPGSGQRHGAVTLPALPPGDQPLNIPGRTRLAPGVVLDATFVTPEAFAEAGAAPLAEAWFDWTALVPPLVVRGRADGDRMRPLGLGGTKKLQDLFVDEKVPRHVRDTVPVVADREGIVWVAGLRTDERVAVKSQTKRILHVRITSL